MIPISLSAIALPDTDLLPCILSSSLGIWPNLARPSAFICRVPRTLDCGYSVFVRHLTTFYDLTSLLMTMISWQVSCSNHATTFNRSALRQLHFRVAIGPALADHGKFCCSDNARLLSRVLACSLALIAGNSPHEALKPRVAHST